MIRPPDDTAPNGLADWLEVSLLLLEDDPRRISDEEIIRAIEGANFDSESDLPNLKAEISRRARLLGGAYPISHDRGGFAQRKTWTNYICYSFMLFVSLNQYYSELVYTRGTAKRPAEIFEDLTGLALAKYITGQVVRIGAPRRNPIPAVFPTAVKYVADLMREECDYGRIEVHFGGDDGLDLIAWRRHTDERPSQMIVFAQCAIGTDWPDKRTGLSLELWNEHIRWHTPPIKAFAVPFCHELGNSWRETAVVGGIIFDRPRIVSLLRPRDVPTALIGQMEQWCRQRLDRVRTLALG
jgi:hypothetical protein